MLMYILVLLCSLAARALAENFQPILTQISAGSSECNNLLGDFDLKTVPQFNALCNIPTPDYQQSEFLLEYNVVPILCMGLMDVSLRLCTSAKSDISPFEDIFPPTAIKFNKIFDGLSKSNDFSLLDEFCSKTVKKFSIKEAASNDTQLWWQILNKELGDEKHCSNICHSNEENKVHPLCSYILWSNGVFINYQKNRIDEEVAMSAGVLQNPSAVENAKEPAEQGINSNQFVKNESPTKSTEAVLGSDPTSPTEEKTHRAEVNKSFTTNNNNVGEGTVEQVVNNIGQSAVADTVKTASNSSTDVGKPTKAPDAAKSKKKIVKETATPSNAGNLKAGIDNTIQEKPVPSAVQSEVKTVTASSSLPGIQSNPGVAAPVAPEPQKQAEGLDIGKAGEGLVEGDVSLEVTPDNTGMDQPIPADKEFQPQYTDEEGEDGDGDDVVIVESNNQANIGTASNGSNSAARKAGSTASNHQGLPEGDKVYGEGEVLIEDHFIEAEDSHFFTYFLCMAVLTIMAYLAFHNKKKLIALAVEGRRTKGGRCRPNSSHYSKLDCSLEEALVSNTTASVTHVLY